MQPTLILVGLDPKFLEKIHELFALCLENGLDVRPTSGLRTLEEQAKIWRRSRTTYLITSEMNKLKLAGCDFLANKIYSVGPQPNGKWGTDEIPGLSWHNWGKALDCLIFVNNKLIEDGGAYCYTLYGQLAKKVGLSIIGPKDAGHVQLNPLNVSRTMTLKEINDHFAAKEQENAGH